MDSADRMAQSWPSAQEAGRLWSLWDMLNFNVSAFYVATSSLQEIRHAVDSGRRKSVEGHDDGSVTVTFITDRETRKFLREHTEKLQESLRVLGAKITLMAADRLRALLDYRDGFTWEAVSAQLGQIDGRMPDELSLVKLFVLDDTAARYFEPPVSLFGQDVADKFVPALFEIDEAAKCFALNRHTACVFHLMRVMEIGIRAVAWFFEISDPTKGGDRGWGNILRDVKAGMDARGGAAPKVAWSRPTDKAFFERIYASLDAIRVAWRNPTMHVENKYTDDEAEHIYVAVKGFMKMLASRLNESGEPKA